MRVLSLLMVLGLLAPVSGGLQLEVAGDGATGVTVRAFGADGRPTETVVRLVLTATAEGGRTVGPIQLNPADEGRGFYSSGPVLSPGHWTVVVTAPDSVRAEAVVEARPAQSPPSPAARAAPPPPSEPSSRLWLWGLAALAVAAGFTAVAVVRLRRS
ncbi:hypothetical protein ABT297_16920 [Dactylosporangium sp. NPDC000555]|uniref:hypothetical protein n=1 Tax=Dactylosporangium sp. NPDC000555 TaxID=3154260 RepID=UPI0033167DF5